MSDQSPDAAAGSYRPLRAADIPPISDEPDQQADEIAPVDRQSDPGLWLSPRAAVIAAIVSTAVLLLTVLICLLIWFTPGMDPLQIPRVDEA